MQAKVFIYRPISCSLHLPPAAFNANDSLTKTKRKQNTNSTHIHFRVLKPLKNIKPFCNYCELHIHKLIISNIFFLVLFPFILHIGSLYESAKANCVGRDFSLLYICWTAYFNFILYPKIASKRVTQLRLYRIVLNDSRLCGRVKNVEEIFDKHYICIVKISNQINCGRRLTKWLFTKRSWIQDDYSMQMIWKWSEMQHLRVKLRSQVPRLMPAVPQHSRT